MNDQPEALRLAQKLENRALLGVGDWFAAELDAARLLREQHAEIERLHKENERLQNTKHYEAPFGFVLNPDYLVPELKAENERLRADINVLREVCAEFGERWAALERKP